MIMMQDHIYRHTFLLSWIETFVMRKTSCRDRHPLYRVILIFHFDNITLNTRVKRARNGKADLNKCDTGKSKTE